MTKKIVRNQASKQKSLKIRQEELKKQAALELAARAIAADIKRYQDATKDTANSSKAEYQKNLIAKFGKPPAGMMYKRGGGLGYMTHKGVHPGFVRKPTNSRMS